MCPRHHLYEETGLEKIMRQELERKKVRFVSQQSFRFGFIADFVLPDCKAIIEVDGHPSHFTVAGQKKKRFRDWMFRRSGLRIYHFTAEEVERNPSLCIDRVLRARDAS